MHVDKVEVLSRAINAMDACVKLRAQIMSTRGINAMDKFVKLRSQIRSIRCKNNATDKCGIWNGQAH